MSLQAKVVKRLLPLQFSGWSEGPIEEQRARYEGNAKRIRLPANVRCQPVSANGVAAEWIEAPGADRGVMLYLHGGAYALGSIDTHREIVARLARATKLRGLAIDYRLAPEHPFPAALEDATAAYGWLLDNGYTPSRVVIAGDSAGGGLALATLVALRDAGQPLPAGAVCISPWTDLALTGASIQGKAAVDPILDPESSERYARSYAGEHERTSPLVSPLYAELTGLPPLLIQVGTDEILLDDARRCAEKAREAGVDVTLEIWKEMFHVFQMVRFLPEAKEAVRHIAEFVSQNVNNDHLRHQLCCRAPDHPLSKEGENKP
jgi:acetyl esterase/lipase